MGRQPPNEFDEQGREDDWLAGEGGLDWFDDTGRGPAEEDWPQQQPSRPAGLVRAPSMRDGMASDEVLRRRRLFAIGAVAAVILIAVIIAVVASGGGGGSSSPATETVAQTPQPATPTETTPTTTAATPTESLTVTVPQGGNLSIGDNGSEVKTLQKALAQLGFYDGAVDGDFGTGTEDAVKAFQTQHNLTPDGIVGNETARAINDAIASSPG